MTATAERPLGAARQRRRRPRRWQPVVSVVLVAWLGAQAVAGWKFANGRTYPVVGSAMFNGPPSGAGHDFMVPRVFVVTADGARLEIDQHTFGLEPFEWRRWIKRHLEEVGDDAARVAADELATVFAGAEPDAPEAMAIELWRVPALDEDLADGTKVRAVRL